MQEFKVIRHSDLTQEWLEEICRIKSISWPHPIESKKKWIEENIRADDNHLFMLTGEVLTAYLNMIRTSVEVDGASIDVMGIGNVCARFKGAGDGRKLMQAA